jgi:hypothetical protein
LDLPTINLACYHDEMRKEQILNIIGWIGTAMVLAGYGLYTFGIIPDVMVYHYLNLIGSVGYRNFKLSSCVAARGYQ